MKTTRMTVAQALVRFLNNQYIEFDGKQTKFVKGIFTVFGHGNVLGLGEALETGGGDLVVHQGRNEQGMALAAMGFAKQTHRKQIYACTSSVGPGAANMLTAAATASANRIPVLFLPGDVYSTRQPDPVLQQMEQYHDMSLSTNDAFRSVSKYWDRITRPELLMTAMIHAMRVLTDPADTGAVTVCLPQDVQGEAYDYPDAFFQKRVHRIERRIPTPEALGEAVALLQRKRKPILVCGGGVRYSEAAEALRLLAEKFNVPFGETQAGKSAIVWDHPLNLGGIGTTGCLSANLLAKDADVVIGVGTRYTDFTTASKSLFQNPDVDFININVAEFDAIKLDAVRVVADAKLGLEALGAELAKTGWKSEYKGEIKDARAQWAKELARLDKITYTGADFKPEVAGQLDHVLAEFGQRTGSYLTQTLVLGVVNELIAKDAIVVGSAGSLPGDMQRMWRPRVANTYHMEYGYSCMGYEISAALGAKLARPGQEVYAMVGDGSYMMLHSELITSIQEGVKINVVLFDNISFGCINNLQIERGLSSNATEFRFRNPKSGRLDGKLIPINFAKNAEAYGCKTYSVFNESELRHALEDAKKQTVSTLIDIKVLPKTMTGGYQAWWRVGNPQVSELARARKATATDNAILDRARRY
jgi:3D-(3,5/4)-trihydroxycyclohexane-1,2-dione acylhydrolase (decyclizing)